MTPVMSYPWEYWRTRAGVSSLSLPNRSGAGTSAPNSATTGDEKRKKLLGEIEATPGVKKVYDAVIRSRGVPVPDEVLSRLLALKEQLKQHPELADRLIGLLQKGEIKDPIKDLIEPMEAEIKKAIEEKSKPATPSQPPPATTPPAQAPPGSQGPAPGSAAPDPCPAAW